MVFTDDNYHDGVTGYSGSIKAFKEGLLVSKDHHHHHHHLTNCQRSGVRCLFDLAGQNVALARKTDDGSLLLLLQLLHIEPP